MDNVTLPKVENTTEVTGPSALELYLRWATAFRAAIARMETPPLATTTISVISMILILFGNLWVVLAVIRQPKLRNSATNIFIVSLSLSDIIIGIVAVPTHIADFAFRRYMSDPVICFLSGFLHSCAMCGTTFSLICIGADRYRAIVQPLKPKMTVKQALISCALVWCICGLISIQTVMNYGIESQILHVGNDTVIVLKLCVPKTDVDKWMRVEYFCILYAIPLIILGVLYGTMIKTLWFSKSPSNSSNRNKKKAVKMLSFVVIQFALTWGPLYALQIYYVHETNPPYHALLFSKTPANITIMISFCNSFINPVLYAYYNENFRKEFIKLFPCFFRKPKVEPETAASANNNKTDTSTSNNTQISSVSSTAN